MNRNEFELAMNEIKQVYGDRAYPTARMEILFENLMVLDLATFGRGIRKIIATEKFAPLMDVFENTFRENMKEAKDRFTEEMRKLNPCITCKSTGRVSQKVNAGEAPYSFRCHCKLGSVLFPSFPNYSHANLKIVRSTEDKPKPKSKINNLDFSEFNGSK